MSTKLYVEGGGKGKAQTIACQRGFRLFLEKAGLAGGMPAVVACGGREQAYGRFKVAHASGGVAAFLLIDAEGPVAGKHGWDHVQQSDAWSRPAGATEEQCHLMVQIMESWFLADRETVAAFYGDGFRENRLPQNRQVEQVPKADVLKGLKEAARNTTKGEYKKGSHSFDILAEIRPALVESAAPVAKRLLDVLRAFAQNSPS